MDQNPANEQRLYKRIKRRFILRTAIFGETPLSWSHVTIFDLSSGGIFFIFDKPVRTGMLLHFKIDFPDRVIECMGRVRRLIAETGGGFQKVGASFEGIQPADRDYIDRFVEASS